MFRLIKELYPVCRSITGDGLRDTLQRLEKQIPLTTHEIATGTEVFDWTIPKEWNIRDGYIKNSQGERLIDFKKSNLHVVNYSVPVCEKMSLSALKEHLFTLPDRPDWIPYRTTYYKESWGFCLRHKQLLELRDEEYEVCIDSTLANGHLTYGEYFIPGESSEEILISCHVCHPSLCNDNLSGISLAVFLAKELASAPRRYSYRFLFIPGTIGSIAWLALNESHLPLIKHGLVLTCVGDAGKITYKKSRRGNTKIDQTFAHVLRHSGQPYEILEFSPYGYDERQYCSPGFDLPIGCFMRTPHGQFPQYHTSADDLDFVNPVSLSDSLSRCLSGLTLLECNKVCLNQKPKCEPRLGKRGLYRSMGGPETETNEMALLWVLSLSDGQRDLLDIADRSNIEFPVISNAAEALLKTDLLKEC